MKKGWIALAAGLLVAGLVLFAAGMTALGWDFSKLGTGKLVTNTHGVSQGFEDIILLTDTADVTFLPSADGKCSVVCREWEKEQHKVFVEDGSLTIRLEDKRAWYEHIGIRFDSPGITVYLPEGQYGTLNIKTDTGDVRLQGVSPERLTVKVSTGNTILQDIACGSLAALGDTGDISLENVVTEGMLSVLCDTGDVRLTRCDGGEISIKTDTGDVSGSLLSEKVFSVHSDTGRVNVPKSVAGGPCEITTDTGDIKITIAD